MSTPQAFNELWNEHQELKRAVARFLSAPKEARDESELWELAGDYEPTEIEQGLIPIPEGYAEQ
jgi:hypothetical protein